MDTLTVTSICTRLFRARESLAAFVIESVPRELVRERAIIAVTSKLASVAEGRTVARDSASKRELVLREADVYLGETTEGVALTIKQSLLIPSAGIDESNSESGDYLLYPEHPFETAERLRAALMAEWGVRELGVLLVDSWIPPLRRGAVGVALAYAGFRGTRSLVGDPDLFGRELKMTRENRADSLASAATAMMGEGAERRPLAIIHGANVEFVEQVDPTEMHMPPELDLWAPLLQASSRSGLKGRGPSSET